MHGSLADPPDLRTRVGIGLATVALFIAIDNVRRFPGIALLPSPGRVLLWKLVQPVLCVVAVMVVHRLRPAPAVAELGLDQSVRSGLRFALLATAPMLLVYGVMARFTVHSSLLAGVQTALASPLAEETLYRGYLFGQLRRRAGLPMWLAVAASAAPFAWGHLYQTEGHGFHVGETLGVLAVTGFGAWFFAWLFERWRWNLWIPIGMHAFMNLWWELFGVDETALGGWLANAARVATIGIAIVLTLRQTKAAVPPS
jgi:membrane protease YdiL (CAAX protease family)